MSTLLKIAADLRDYARDAEGMARAYSYERRDECALAYRIRAETMNEIAEIIEGAVRQEEQP